MRRTIFFSVFVLFTALILPLSAQERMLVHSPAKTSNCLSTDSDSWPYTPNFDQASEKSHWSQKSMNELISGEQDFISLPWKFKKLTDQSETYPFIEYAEGSEHDGSIPTLYTPCMELRKSETYKLSFTIDASTTTSSTTFRIWLYPKSGPDKFNYWINPTEAQKETYLVKEFTIDKGTYPEQFLIIPPTDSTYAIGIEIQNPYGLVGPLYLKNFRFEKLQLADHALGNVISPISVCDLDRDEVISIRFKNKGSLPVNSLKAYYSLDGGTPVAQSFSLGGLASEKEAALRFSQKADFSQSKEYSLKVWLEKNPNDGNVSNDTIVRKISKTSYVYTVPCSWNFSTTLQRSQWNVLAKTFENSQTWNWQSANGISYAQIQTHLDAVSDALISPCVQMKAGTTYQIRFWYRALSESLGENLTLRLISDHSDLQSGKEIWSRENFTSINNGTPNISGYTEAFTYYTATQDLEYFLVFSAYSQAAKKGIALTQISIEESELREIPFMQGFEEEDVSSFVQTADVNLDNITWKVEQDNPINAYNSKAYASITGDGRTGYQYNANDWLLLDPVYLEEGITYYFSHQSRYSVASQEYTVAISDNFHHKSFFQTPLHTWQDTTKTPNYSGKLHYFSVPIAGVYYIGFRSKMAQIQKSLILYLDNVVLLDSVKAQDTNIALTALEIPSNASTGTAVESPTLHYVNRTGLELANVSFYYQVNKEETIEANAGLMNPYQSGSYRFTVPIDFRVGDTFYIKAWLRCPGDKTNSDDTLRTTIIVPKPIQPPLVCNFEKGEDYSKWYSYKSQASAPGFTIDKINTQFAREGEGYLYSGAQQNVSNSYFVSPALWLSDDTTYCLRFYYANGTQGQYPSNLSVLINDQNQNIPNFHPNNFGWCDSLVILRDFSQSNYKSALCYFRVPKSGRYFMAFHNFSQSEGKDIRIDNLLLIDSITAETPYIKIDSLEIPPQNLCDLEKEKIHIRIRNTGMITVKEKQVFLQFGSKEQIIQETLSMDLAVDTFSWYTLKTLWEFPDAASDSVRIWIDNDTTPYYVLNRQYPQSFPFFSGFEPSEIFSWTVYNQEKKAVSWNIGTGVEAYKGVAYATHISQINGQSDSWLISPCLEWKVDTSYVLDFFYKTINPTAVEKMDVYLLRRVREQEIEKLENLQLITQLDKIDNTNYRKFSDTIQVAQSGKYHLAFRERSSIQGSQLFLDDIHLFKKPALVEDTVPIPPLIDTACYRIELLEILSPKGEPPFTARESLSFSIRNSSNVGVNKVPYVIKFNTSIYTGLSDSIAPGQIHTQTFGQSLNMFLNRDYNIVIYASFPLDTSKEKDTLVVFFKQVDTLPIKPPAIESSFDALKNVKLYPNPTYADIYFQSDQNIRYIEIFDAMGILRRSIRIQDDKGKIEMQNFATGLYLLRFHTSEGDNSVRRVLKK